MLPSSDRKKLWTQASAVIAVVTALAGLIQALNAIAHGGRSAVMVANDLLLYTGNIALYAFTLLVLLVLLLKWIEKSESHSPASSAGAFYVVAGLALVGGVYWGITGDLYFGHLATRAIGGVLLALLMAFLAYLSAPTPAVEIREGDEGEESTRANSDNPAMTYAKVAGGVVGFCAFVLIAIGNANGYSRGGFRSDVAVGSEVIIADPGLGRSWIATPTKAGYISAVNASREPDRSEFHSLVARGDVMLIQTHTSARVVERKADEWIVCVRFLDGPFRDRAGWVNVECIQPVSQKP